MIYLDHNATTPISPPVLQAMMPFFQENFGNASSFYRIGRIARTGLEEARACVAAVIHSSPEEIVFTGSGTEADNLAFRGVCRAFYGRRRHIVTSSIEHHAVLKTCEDLEEQGVAVTRLPVDSQGAVDPDQVLQSLTPDTVLISIMAANNETGVLQPIEAISRIARSRGILFHTDAVQAFGKVPVSVDDLGIDLMTLSAHKIYGPKGVGALYVRKGSAMAPVLTGGSHERGKRAGTENIAAIAGFAKAAELAVENLAQDAVHMTALRDAFEEQVVQRIAQVRVNGRDASRVPNTSSMSFASVDGESILLHLDLKGICASTGSACATGSAQPSHVMRAMGLSPMDAQSTIRFSLGRDTSQGDLDFTVRVLEDTIEKLRYISSTA